MIKNTPKSTMPLYPMEMCAPSMMEVPRSCAPSSSEALADMV